MHNATELESLDYKQCLALMRTQAVGRLVFTDHALPAVRPVNFTLRQGEVILRLGRSPWVRRLDHTVVAFEVDQIDQTAQAGWSVVVVGKARLLVDIDELVTNSDPLHRSWAPGPRDQTLAIDIEQITGRRLLTAAS
ncbi:pyridoxamine 5'-phosphate oxidase family protein [Amycolatopsis sp. K13G38]|uniref:Pyridoxamine 5'-phosphate oxidase family protein n=1 Tax=Amycolatopsis acididurans TaxID=2724524 RepID=A0ABX1JH75_9PSEU|nr:pyridoxamine 5'-phosphate oxidase family protein [Amycolatopsis acididurans]NKQ57592.1 pyridoxamine 5'-phosphate oxidase family protein [Amycolatopsis acididurans]